MLKLLIISLSVGAGHVRAAEAVRKTAELYFPDIKSTHIDLADYISLAMKKTVLDSYALMAKTMPELYGFLYDQTNKPKNTDRLNKITKQLKRMNCSRLYNYLQKTKPDIILCTHCLASDIILNAPAKYKISAPVSVIITDYDLHNLWIVPGTRHYFVATEKMKWKMAQSNIPENQITASGIPIDPVFFVDKSIAELKNKYHLPPGKKTLLILSGGQGLRKSDEIVKTLMQSTEPLNIIAVAGKNKKLEQGLKKITAPARHNYFSLGWTQDMDEYMRLADIIITKPGGITTTECITLGKPIIAVNPIPGQEECNAEFILSNGCGQVARSSEDLLYYIEHPFVYQKTKMKNAGEIVLNELKKQ